MHRIKIISTILFILFLSFHLPAEIAIVQVVPSDGSQSCSGTFTVRANGTAGPFTVVVPNPTKGGPDLVYTNVTSSVVLDGFCNGTYSVRVFPNRFPSCITYLEAVLKSSKINNEANSIGDKAFSLDVSPNPTRGEVVISVVTSEGKRAQLPAAGSWTITVTDANGVFQQERKLEARSAKSNRESFPLDLSQYPRGVYFISVTDPFGVKETSRVVVQ